jgi:hypothetical protein
MAVNVVGLQIQALVVQRFRLLNHLGIFLRNPQLVIGRGKIVVSVWIGGIGLLCRLKLLQCLSVPPLLVQANSKRILPHAGHSTSTADDEETPQQTALEQPAAAWIVF